MAASIGVRPTTQASHRRELSRASSSTEYRKGKKNSVVEALWRLGMDAIPSETKVGRERPVGAFELRQAELPRQVS